MLIDSLVLFISCCESNFIFKDLYFDNSQASSSWSHD